MHHLLDTFGNRIRLTAIYIVEAHAVDEWPIGDVLQIRQPKSTAERCGVARAFVEQYQFRVPTLIDLIDNNFSDTYAAWPIRFYVIQDGKLTYIATPDENNTYDSIIPELNDFLVHVV